MFGDDPLDNLPADQPHDAESPAVGSDAFFEQVYDELRAIARARMRGERNGHTLQSTELVHEAYLRLAPGGGAGWKSRGHFFAAAAEAMRRILIERARARGRIKRGGDPEGKPAPKLALDLEEVAALADDHDAETILALDRAIERLSRRDERLARIVKLRFYAGLSVEEVAGTLGITPRTVLRDWAFARAWLYRQLASDSGGKSSG
jgi:RNA polymerase sigma factor (TIGR02999 family)